MLKWAKLAKNTRLLKGWGKEPMEWSSKPETTSLKNSWLSRRSKSKTKMMESHLPLCGKFQFSKNCKNIPTSLSNSFDIQLARSRLQPYWKKSLLDFLVSGLWSQKIFGRVQTDHNSLPSQAFPLSTHQWNRILPHKENFT